MDLTTVQNLSIGKPELAIFDVEKIETTPTFFAIYPSFYNVRIVFSPLVIQRMLQWLIKEGYIELEGKLSIRIRNRKSKVYVTG